MSGGMHVVLHILLIVENIVILQRGISTVATLPVS